MADMGANDTDIGANNTTDMPDDLTAVSPAHFPRLCSHQNRQGQNWCKPSWCPCSEGTPGVYFCGTGKNNCLIGKQYFCGKFQASQGAAGRACQNFLSTECENGTSTTNHSSS
jgi:hypothetical protein